MLKSLNKIKVATIILGSLSVASGIGIGTYFALANKKETPNDFNAVIFDDILFTSKSQLLDYIKNNTQEIEKRVGQDIFVVDQGNDKYNFNTYEEAFKYIAKYLKTEEVYLKPGSTIDQEFSTISPESFVKKDGTVKYLVFAKYSGDNEKHQYLSIRANSSQEKIDQVRNEAAISYIQIHSGYKFNNIYFYTINDVYSYIKMNWANIKSFDEDKVGNLKALFLENGQMITFDKNLDAENLKNDDNFIQQILNNIAPYYKYGDKFLEVAQNNINDIKNILDESELDYLKIESNNSEITQIVDMDNTTPNGNIYGPYYVTSGMGMENVADNANWKNVPNNTPLPQLKELVDISILKSTINYLVKTRGFNSVIDFLYVTKIPNSPITMADYILTKFNQGNYYLEKMVSLIQNISHGVRANHLDNMIALYSFTIDMLIQNQENVSKIIEVAKYFDSMMQILDSLLETFLAPFLMEDDKNQPIKPSNYNLDYFQSAFSFYDAQSLGKGIHFQKNPYSYYRQLVGSSDNETSKKNRDIFKLIEAAMGIHGIAMNALVQNQEIYQEWSTTYQEKLLYNQSHKLESDFGQAEITFGAEPKKNQMWDFSFSQPASASEEEKNAIWSNLSDIQNNFVFGTQVINPKTIWKNANVYLQTIQNAYIEEYKRSILENIQEITSLYKGGTSEEIDEQTGETIIVENKPKIYTKEDVSFFALNTIDFINIQKNDIFDGHVTTANKFNNLKNMVESAVTPLKERIMNFAVEIGTISTQVAIAIATAASASEAILIEKGLSKEKISSSQKITAITDDFIINAKRSTTYEISNSWMRETKIKINGDSFIKKLQNDVDWSILGSAEKENKAINVLSDVYASFFDFGSSSLNQIIKDVTTVYLRILANVVPVVDMIFKVIENFASSERQIYSYSQAEDGTTLYWDGGLVEYSWWGLKADQKYSIKDLKMIEPQKIISAYPTSYIYYGDEVHETLDILKYNQAQKMIENALNFNRQLLDDRNYVAEEGLSNIYWSINIKNISNLDDPNAYFQSTEELINYVIMYGLSEIPKEIFKTASGLISADPQVIQEDIINSTLENLKNILMLRLPDFVNGKPISTTDFQLPFPYWESGKLIKAKTEKEELNNNYVIFDPNIDINSLDDALDNIGVKDKELKKTLNSILETISAQDYQSSAYSIDKLLKPYINNIFVPQKEVIFQEVNDQKNHYFEDFDNSWTKTSKPVFYFKNADGQIVYYTDKKVALKQLINPQNYNLSISNLGHETLVYLFNDFIYSSIDQIYDYIVKQGKENS